MTIKKLGGWGWEDITSLVLTPHAVFTSSKTLLAHSYQQITRILLLNLVTWKRHKQVCRIVAPRLELFSLTGEEPAMAREGAG